VTCTLMRYMRMRATPLRATPMRGTPIEYTPMRCTHKVQARETHAREMHACETPANEMHTREIYAHRSMAFVGGMAVRVLQRGAPEPRYLHSPATMTSTRFTKHNKRPLSESLVVSLSST
jgi:hypothetical protein